jgi:hypothetical protein
VGDEDEDDDDDDEDDEDDEEDDMIICEELCVKGKRKCESPS